MASTPPIPILPGPIFSKKPWSYVSAKAGSHYNRNNSYTQCQTRLIEKNPKIDTTQKLETLLGNFYGTGKRICVPVVNGLVVLKVEDIVRCESDINYTTLFMNDKQKLTVAKILKEFEEMLVDYNFFRVHNSHLINLAYVKSYNKGKGGFVTMMDGTGIEVSTRRKEDFLKKLTAI